MRNATSITRRGEATAAQNATRAARPSLRAEAGRGILGRAMCLVAL
ncbi:MAG: hypothetical protein M3N47_02245 [Chloroflexota bacterium]|nr:hypothetical protein [Chloroflexota bacterium]